MIATTTKKKEMAVLMTATILAAGISIAPFLGAEAGVINTTRSNIKSSPIVQQEADQSCTNQAQDQGGQQAVPNTEQNAITGEGDPVPGFPPLVNAEQSNECSIAMEQTVEQNGDTEDFSTNEWTE